ncbi:MAG: N-6 DNA methylase [Deltaproteobacteria bacterium HGW-Deltaproteobacteria-19]|jgi:type I restriction enzyme M protein|nr:MAG: N-6 DNA methylase [Deltaproteobacteria bacterium HGW-Deltaproteobacteria-19]
MLTQEIKQKIDSARNILVGKIPTPTGQVEQITLALVFKFMNDIDDQNVELGGSHKFFTGEYQKYAWKHLLDKSLSAYERVTLYGEGLEKMHLNPNLPQFFRNVFKSAFLPFRDPEVLTLFLKEIDGFKYGHNGDLGDAFEYLLQVMGTQGDAGQFLTPRHIINFIVSVVDPQKTDKILDPAVGTAGFLISTYHHLLRMNTKEGFNKPGSSLTTDERKRFANNFVGYDISHDMVRLSLVNMYLHDFPDPKIHEYDTLGNLDKWDDDFDCILTNPPFMTPKGGVKPHKRFSIQAKRSEVLFVDYIMEHLNPNGKAGIIVPEGIIFQSANAYKALRKMMVDQNYLYAVVSLPAGIFQPYSGVKTSIVLMDRVLAKKTKDILFIKIENDGFDLGAQRRPSDKNDLPNAVKILQKFKTCIQTGESFVLSEEDILIASLAPIEKISKSGDYNLSGDRYKETVAFKNQRWPLVELGNDAYFTIESGGTPDSSNPLLWNGEVNWVTLSDLPQRNFITIITDTERTISEEGLRQSSAKILPVNSILVSSRATIGRVAVNKIPVATNQGFKNIIIKDSDRTNPSFVAYMVTNLVETMKNVASGGTFKEISKTNISRLGIPLPPFKVQKDIVSQLDRYKKIIDGARQVIDNYIPEIKIDPDWKMVDIGDVYDIQYGVSESIPDKIDCTGINIISTAELKLDGALDLSSIRKITFKDEYRKYILRPDTLLFNWRNAPKHVGKTAIFNDTDQQYIFASFLLALTKKSNDIENKFCWIWLNRLRREEYFKRHSRQAVNQTNFNAELLKNTKLPLPELNIQRNIIARIDEEQRLVKATFNLIKMYENKIKEDINDLWGS